MTQDQKPFRNEVVKAGFWSFLLHAGSRLIGFARTLVVARLLSPNDIGLFAITTIVLTLIETFSNPGFQAALIRRKSDITDHLNVAWTVNALLGLVRAIIMFFSAPFVAVFFEVQSVIPFIRVLAFAVLISGFSNPGVIYWRKELDFRRHFTFMFSGIIADLVVAVGAAIYFRNAWALVYGLLARQVVQTMLSYFLHPFRPCFKFDWVIFKKLFDYGIWVSLVGMMTCLANDGASVAIGRLVDTYALGLYQIAFWITESTLVEMAGVFGAVAFSAYSKIQNDPVALRSAFIRTAGFKLSVILPVTAGIIVAGDLFLMLFLGETWERSIPVLTLLSVSGCFLAISNTGQPVFMALGQPKFLFYLHAVRATILLSFVIPLTIQNSIEGAATAMVISNASVLLFSMYKVKKTLFLTHRDFVLLFAPGLIATAIMTLGILLLKYFANYAAALPKATIFMAIIISGAFIYLFILKKLETRIPQNQPLQALGLLAENSFKVKL